MSLFDRGSKRASSARVIALVGIMAATIECAKLALMFLPNIEVVTILSALYGYVFGIYGVIATIVFVCIEPLIYGFGTWVVSYFLSWRKKFIKFSTIILIELYTGHCKYLVIDKDNFAIASYFFYNACFIFGICM